MVSFIFFIILGIIFIGAIIYMLLHKRKTRLENRPDNPVAEENFDKDAGA